ncbi:hypothetical protein Y1Q_0007356 [Alligator mississippiensis]|uniref:Uncharacterized protein n=1 Tax=Alligator mississippiensis TaxID=8496 RepID=A0A151P7I1_ALLMI|nr:hypothetical protein Y1Q_0007356 [Alligator mississippiensis]
MKNVSRESCAISTPGNSCESSLSGAACQACCSGVCPPVPLCQHQVLEELNCNPEHTRWTPGEQCIC